MGRHILSLSHERLKAFDLHALIDHAEALNQHNRDIFTTPFPKSEKTRSPSLPKSAAKAVL